MTFQEVDQREALEYQERLRQREDTARGSFFRCGECGTMDGVEIWTRGQIKEVEEVAPFNVPLYRDTREDDTGHCLYSLCPYCCAGPPPWLESVTPEEVAAWREEGCWCGACVPF